MLETILPAGEPIIGRHGRLDLLAEVDLDEMYPLLSDPGSGPPRHPSRQTL